MPKIQSSTAPQVSTSTASVNAGTNISALKAVYVDETTGQLFYADSATPSNAPFTIGISIVSATTGNPCPVRTFGMMYDPAFSFVSGAVFVGATGGLTQTNPVSGFSQKVGFAMNANTIFVKVESPIIL